MNIKSLFVIILSLTSAFRIYAVQKLPPQHGVKLPAVVDSDALYFAVARGALSGRLSNRALVSV